VATTFQIMRLDVDSRAEPDRHRIAISSWISSSPKAGDRKNPTEESAESAGYRCQRLAVRRHRSPAPAFVAVPPPRPPQTPRHPPLAVFPRGCVPAPSARRPSAESRSPHANVPRRPEGLPLLSAALKVFQSGEVGEKDRDSPLLSNFPSQRQALR